MIITEANLTINVKDLDKSMAFYDSLGLTLKNRWGNYYAQMIAPGLTLGLHPSKDSSKGSGGLSVGFTVNDFEAARKELEGKGVNVNVRKEEGGEFFHFEDPDGTALYLIKPRS